jgi:hypothetical protein
LPDCPFADGKKHKLSKDLDTLKAGHNGPTVDVIIQYNVPPTDAHHQKVQNKGGVLKTKLDFIKGAHYSVPVEALDDLADDPDVAYISPDREVSGSLDYVTSAVGAPTAWYIYGLDGSGVGVAVIDSGIHKSSDFKDASGKNRGLYDRILSAVEQMTPTVMELMSPVSWAAPGKPQRAPIARALSRESRPTST